eukprot:gene23377-12470_t
MGKGGEKMVNTVERPPTTQADSDSDSGSDSASLTHSEAEAEVAPAGGWEEVRIAPNGEVWTREQFLKMFSGGTAEWDAAADRTAEWGAATAEAEAEAEAQAMATFQRRHALIQEQDNKEEIANLVTRAWSAGVMTLGCIFKCLKR